MNNLVLNLKREYFNEIKQGKKNMEYRLCTPYWQKRLFNKNFNKIIIRLGYPIKNSFDKELTFEWNGFSVKEIKHKEFGDNLVKVFAINLDKRIFNKVRCKNCNNLLSDDELKYYEYFCEICESKNDYKND